MNTARLKRTAAIENNPLELVDAPIPDVPERTVLVRVTVCGVCHTDLHIVEGDLRLPKLPVVPGHQIVGMVTQVGSGVRTVSIGQRVGIPWLHMTCGTCKYCRSGRENLCENARFTGYHVDGGFAEYVAANESAVYVLPEGFDDVTAAPLLCAGVIGFRALRLSDIRPGGRIGLYGFGASAHIALQVLRFRGCETYVFTRSPTHRDLAMELGAAWVGTAEERPPHELDSAVIFAPAGTLVPAALRALSRGGTLALAGIHMSTIPAMEYSLLYQERTVRSVANSTRSDVRELLDLAARIPLRTEVETFPLDRVNDVLLRLKQSALRASAVLRIGN
jgi:alcohol dehydrogenase, propanol-preferring